MRTAWSWLVVLTLLFSPIVVSAQRPKRKDIPGHIVLLEGYHHVVTDGFDSITGRIWKEGGVDIRYDLFMAGHYEDRKEWTTKIKWKREQVIGGRRVICVLTKDNRLLIAFPEYMANFYAKVRNEKDVADMLLMILTYKSVTATHQESSE